MTLVHHGFTESVAPQETPRAQFDCSPTLVRLGHGALSRIDYDTHGLDGVVVFSNEETGFTLTATREFYSLIGGFTKSKEAFAEIEQSVIGDPFGQNNIDTHRTALFAQQARIIQKIPDGSILAKLVPQKNFAIKTFGTNPEQASTCNANQGFKLSTPAEQFRHTLEFKRIQERTAPNGFFGIIKPLEVYAALREPCDSNGMPGREWLLMEYIETNRPVTTSNHVVNGRSVEAFYSDQYPDLTSILNSPYARKVYPFSDIPRMIATKYPDAAPYVCDLHADNLLETLVSCPQTGRVKKHYTIIDIETDESIRLANM